MGEVSGGVVLAAVMLMLVLAVGQGKWEYFQEMVWNSSFSGRKIMESGYDVICAFSGLGLLPFALDSVGTVKIQGNCKFCRFYPGNFAYSDGVTASFRIWMGAAEI